MTQEALDARDILRQNEAMELGEMIRAARKARGLTAKQLAERVGIKSFLGVFKYESGGRIPQLGTLRSLVEVLDLPRREALLAAWPATRWFLEEDEKDSPG